MDPFASSASKPSLLPRFGRFELLRLLGKSVATMVWLASDAGAARELMLVLPREQPSGTQSLDAWLEGARKAARLNHPQLAAVAEVGVQDRWPYVTVDRRHGVTLSEWLAAHPASTPAEMVDLMIQALQGLAYAHEAGIAHCDVQSFTLLVNGQRETRWMALGAAGESGLPKPASKGTGPAPHGSASDLQQLHRHRHLAERDLLGCGLLMHCWLAGVYALEEPDITTAIARLAPSGHEIVRLPYTTTPTVPEALRAIVNRCTSNQERQRYHSARTLLRALEGWRQAQGLDSGGPLALLMNRMQRVGHLPAQPGLAARLARMAGPEGQHAEEMAEQVLQDIALSLELLRSSNSVQIRRSMLAGDGPILAIRRSIALLGIDGVRRAANALRLWPGPLQATQAGAMRRLIDHVRLAAYAGQALRPAGYDAEVVFLVVVLQNLGRLLVQYHFPEEAEQIQQLMQPISSPSDASGTAIESPGLSEDAAANAVLGVDLGVLRAAVVRHWGLGEDVVQMIRPLPGDKAVRAPDSDGELLRATACAANELADAGRLEPAQRSAAAVANVAAKYFSVLKVSVRELHETLQSARAVVHAAGAVAATVRVSAVSATAD
ncbi:MAG: HDOD domain-containing protein [Burkholderiaceae bacterium]